MIPLFEYKDTIYLAVQSKPSVFSLCIGFSLNMPQCGLESQGIWLPWGVGGREGLTGSLGWLQCAGLSGNAVNRKVPKNRRCDDFVY